MPNLGGPELIIVLAIFVLLFGARKLPELGGSIGKSIRNFKQGVSNAAGDETDEDDERDAAVDERPRAVTSGEQQTSHVADDAERVRQDRR